MAEVNENGEEMLDNGEGIGKIVITHEVSGASLDTVGAEDTIATVIGKRRKPQRVLYLTTIPDKDVELAARHVASEFGIDPFLMVGLVLVDGGHWGNPTFVESYNHLWDSVSNAPFRDCTDEELKDCIPPADFLLANPQNPEEEWVAQRTAYGASQVMGAVARSVGYTEDLGKLGGHDGLLVTAQYLQKLYKLHGNTGDVLSAWYSLIPDTAADHWYISVVTNRSNAYRAWYTHGRRMEYS